ncbi:portal protein [Rhodoferax sp.]|uniref:portal protein n=1 Tax=Rhodoferax sp. TaxID=50421 RepID=UPI002ACEAAA9|nr:portal protein [Rhodoferax sp.]MDZ7918507.1 portal protein [Rhodoferax sp.]
MQDRNRGEKRHNNILDSTGTKALRTCSAGIMSSATSPARPWFRLTTSDPKLDESVNVKLWLAGVERSMRMVFSKSNTYLGLHRMYDELIAFGTASNIVLPNFQNVIHHHSLTAGEYAIATNADGVVDTLYREFQMTCGQMVKEFGTDRVGDNVRNAFTAGRLGQWFTVMHCIEPRADRDTGKRDNLNMPWKSVYFELGVNETQLLRETGFKSFPALCPRWMLAGGDIYGSSPGMDALGDIKQLQHEQFRKGQAIDFMTKPPLQASGNMVNKEIDSLPGGVTYVDQVGAQSGVRNLFDTRIDLSHLLMDINDVRERIRGAFFADLFLMLSGAADGRKTATEVAELHEEKMLMLGPVSERLHNELLGPKIDMTFEYMVQAGMVPRPPDELNGMELNVEYVSVLAQAQRAVATNSTDRYVMGLGQVAQFKPDVLDKLDADKWADEYADMLGINPELIVANDQVALIRKQRAQAQQAAQQAAQMEQMAGAAQKLGTVQTSSGNAANDVMQSLTGYTT